MVPGLEHQAHHVANKIERKLSHAVDPNKRRREIDEFLKPLQHSRMAHSRAAALFRALLEERARHGEGPEDVVREAWERGSKLAHHHRHEILLAADFLRSLKHGDGVRRIREEILAPAQQRSISGDEAWKRLKEMLTYYPHRTPLIGGAVGIGITGGAEAVVGVSGGVEFLGGRYLTPALYFGGEVTLGADVGAEFDAVMEVGFQSPGNFGGPYWAIGGGLGDVVGVIVQVSFALPSKQFQGFTVGIGVGIEVDFGCAIGDGLVVPMIPGPTHA